jgi:proline iminopeptidase
MKFPDSCAQAPINQEMYESMWGPTEFNATGTLRTFDVTPRLRELTMPTMIVVGRHDEVRVETAEKFRAAIPGAIVKVIENSGHMAPLQAYDSYALVLEDFFRAVDRGSR